MGDVTLADRKPEAPVRVTQDVEKSWLAPWVWIPLLTAGLLAVAGQMYPRFYAAYIAPETGVLENVQVLINLTTVVVAARLLGRGAVGKATWLRIWILLILLGSIYIAGEEASWGQHYLGWATPESWQAVNDQQETNIHNTSSWFDQKPRVALEIAVLFGALLLPLARGTRLYPRRPKMAYLIPSTRGVPAAAMVLLARVDDWVVDLYGSSLFFFRPAEVEELFIYMVVLIYTTDLLRRVNHGPPPA